MIKKGCGPAQSSQAYRGGNSYLGASACRLVFTCQKAFRPAGRMASPWRMLYTCRTTFPEKSSKIRPPAENFFTLFHARGWQSWSIALSKGQVAKRRQDGSRGAKRSPARPGERSPRTRRRTIEPRRGDRCHQALPPPRGWSVFNARSGGLRRRLPSEDPSGLREFVN